MSLTKAFTAKVFRNAADNFPEVQNSNVLIYWPHGMGDFVFLSNIIKLLEPSNRYFIARFGDGSTSLFDSCPHITPLYIGQSSSEESDGAKSGNEHLGLRHTPSGGTKEVRLPGGLWHQCQQHRIDVILDLPFHETYGSREFPFHSKGRYMLKSLVQTRRLLKLDLSRPLSSAFSFGSPAAIAQFVEALLQSRCGLGDRKMCLISRTGYTNVGKNWGHLWRNEGAATDRPEGEEARNFMRLMLHHDPTWFFISMEDREFSGVHTLRSPALRCYSFHELFGPCRDSALPFGLLLRTLLQFASLSVGVPTGPQHLANVYPGLPTVGIWLEHHPSWYDEPTPDSIHLLSHNLRETHKDQRLGSFVKAGSLEYRCQWQKTLNISGEAVFQAAQELLGTANPRTPLLPPQPSIATSEQEHAAATGLIAVTIAVGEKYEFIVTWAAATCRRQTGLPVYILGQAAMTKYGVTDPMRLKMNLLQEFPRADGILFFDADLLFLQPICPDKLFVTRDFVCVTDQQEKSYIIKDAQRVGIPIEEYFNSGLFVVRPEHQPMLELAARIYGDLRGSPFPEQGALNAARVQIKIQTTWLDKYHNFVNFELAPDSSKVLVGHCIALKRRPQTSIRRFYQFWCAHQVATGSDAEAVKAELTESRWSYDRVGFDSRPLTFAPDGTIKEGVAGRERRWSISREEGELVLWIIGDQQPTCALTRSTPEYPWSGRWLLREQMPIELTRA